MAAEWQGRMMLSVPLDSAPLDLRNDPSTCSNLLLLTKLTKITKFKVFVFLKYRKNPHLFIWLWPNSWLETAETALFILWISLSRNIKKPFHLYFFTLLDVLTIVNHTSADFGILISPLLSPLTSQFLSQESSPVHSPGFVLAHTEHTSSLWTSTSIQYTSYAHSNCIDYRPFSSASKPCIINLHVLTITKGA